jgi:hypothetical protein
MLPYRLFGRSSSNFVNRYDGNGVMSNKHQTFSGIPSSCRSYPKLTKTRELHLGTVGAFPKSCLFPQTSIFSVLPPRTLIQATAFLEQIKSGLAPTLVRQALPASNFKFQDVASSGKPHANLRVRQLSGQANKRSGFNTAQVGGGMQCTTRELGCANQDTCPFDLTIACLH